MFTLEDLVALSWKKSPKTARNISKNTTIIIPEHNIPAFKPAKTFVVQVKDGSQKEKK